MVVDRESGGGQVEWIGSDGGQGKCTGRVVVDKKSGGGQGEWWWIGREDRESGGGQGEWWWTGRVDRELSLIHI